jgi:hypothetical protein
MSLLLLALSRPVLVRSCPAGVVPLVGKFKVAQIATDLNDDYEVSSDDGNLLATVSDSPSWPKVMTVYTSSGEPWASATQDFTGGEVSFWDCAGGLVARLKSPDSGTVMQDRDGNNVAEVTTESLEASETWQQRKRVTLSGEPQLAGEAGEKLATLVQENSGVAFQITVEILGKVWHHTPQVQPATGEGGEEGLKVAGRRLGKKANSTKDSTNKTKSQGDDPDGNPALDPLVVVLFATQTMGYSHWMPGGKFVTLASIAGVVFLTCVSVLCCCVVLKARKGGDEYIDEGFVTEEDYDSDQERAKVCAPGACCSRGPVSGSSYTSLPKASWKPPPRLGPPRVRNSRSFWFSCRRAPFSASTC